MRRPPPPRRVRLTRRDARYALRRTLHAFSARRGVDQAAALTTYACLALLPIALTLVSALALVTGRGRAIEALLDTVAVVASPATVAGLRDPLTQLTTIPAPGVALAIGLVLTVWAVSGWAMGFGRVLNGFSDVPEGRPEWRFRLAMVVLAVPLIAGLLVCAGLLLATPQIVGPLAERAGVAGPWLVLAQAAKWPVLAAVLALMLAALLRWAPNTERRLLGPTIWSALVVVGGCFAATAAFGLYLTTLGHYDAVYGWLGSALVLLIWLFLVDVVLVYGAALDVELVRVRQLRDGIPAERAVKVPLRDTTRVAAADRALRRLEAQGAVIRRGGGYRGAMSRKEPDGTPSIDEVEHDFAMPEDADLRPVDDEGRVEQDGPVER
ncbi:YihY/virulence factor BrkB family protein [Amnibacterium endophyticum]|uniref:YihY/virulence factor BrkB family protein n=1 Tax=Amnibacterium endophyticum TaxID=2109337 RepID=A0ABW4LHJ3_9MICO